MSAFTPVNYLGESIIISRGYQLCSLLTVCEQAARSLDNVGDGKYRDNVTSSLAGVMELASDIATDVLIALEEAEPRTMKGGQENG